MFCVKLAVASLGPNGPLYGCRQRKQNLGILGRYLTEFKKSRLQSFLKVIHDQESELIEIFHSSCLFINQLRQQRLGREVLNRVKGC